MGCGCVESQTHYLLCAHEKSVAARSISVDLVRAVLDGLNTCPGNTKIVRMILEAREDKITVGAIDAVDAALAMALEKQ